MEAVFISVDFRKTMQSVSSVCVCVCVQAPLCVYVKKSKPEPSVAGVCSVRCLSPLLSFVCERVKRQADSSSTVSTGGKKTLQLSTLSPASGTQNPALKGRQLERQRHEGSYQFLGRQETNWQFSGFFGTLLRHL